MKKEFKDKAEAEKFYDALRAENKYQFDAYMLPDNQGYGLQWIESKTYVAHDGKEFPDEAWLTEAGDLVLIQDLSEAHAKNIIRMMIRKDRAAYEMITGLMSGNGDDDEDGDEFPEDMEELLPNFQVPHTLH